MRSISLSNCVVRISLEARVCARHLAIGVLYESHFFAATPGLGSREGPCRGASTEVRVAFWKRSSLLSVARRLECYRY